MGYRIEYQPVKKVRGIEKRTSKIPALTALFFLLFFFLVFSFWPDGAHILREILIPGDPDVTVMALETFAQDLRTGGTFSDAFEVFCRRILTEAGFGQG